MVVETLLVSVVTALAGAGAVYVLLSKAKKTSAPTPEDTTETKEKAVNIIESAKNEAQKIVLDAKTQALDFKQQAERESAEIRKKVIEAEKTAQLRIDEAYKRQKDLEEKEKQIEEIKRRIQGQLQGAEKARQEQTDKLQTIASLTKEEAKQLILSNLEKTLTLDVAKRIKESEEKIKLESDKIAQEILLDAMQQASTDYVSEYTISSVKLEDPDIKGRIIGKEGRNIKAFEDATGVNVDFDEEANLVRLSCFDAVRREIARISLEKLIKDGRIHPARIEEVVQKTQNEIQKIILEAGEELCQKIGVYNLPKELVEKLGNFKYRTSYGQNMLQHTLEEAKMGVKIAHEIGANVAITKLACLLHDIGKVITDKEGNHIELGAEYLKKFNLPPQVISAVAEHHDDKPSTMEGVIVQIADSISGSRPGARYEDFENFVQRMTKLEQVALSFGGIARAYAISAGREVRVIVIPDEVSDADAVKLSHDIAEKIQNELTYPGTVKVIVIRETRSIATAS